MSQGLGASFDAAQRAYENRTPEDDDDPCAEECERCHGNGFLQRLPGEENRKDCPVCGGASVIFHHAWRMIPGEAKDGTRFRKCTRCGLEEEI